VKVTGARGGASVRSLGSLVTFFPVDRKVFPPRSRPFSIFAASSSSSPPRPRSPCSFSAYFAAGASTSTGSIRPSLAR